MAENATEQPELDTEVADSAALDAPDAVAAAEIEHEELDPEAAARRTAALAHVRKFGDPVLRTRSRPVDRFDDALRDEVERMGQLMVDSIGVGLAATQVGVLHRLLVYRVHQQSSVAALVNPEVEWTGDQLRDARGGLPEPAGGPCRRRAPGPHPGAGQDEFGEPIVIEASGLEARVIQHEIDHLDGVLVLDRISRSQRKEAMRRCARRRVGLAPARPRCAPSIWARRSSPPGPARARRLAAPPGARGHPARPPARPRPAARRRRRWPTAARELGIDLDQPESVNADAARERIAAARSRRRLRLRVRRARSGAAAVRSPDRSTSIPRCCPRWRGAAPIERAIMAGDERTGVSIMRLTAGLDSGPVCLTADEPIGPQDTYGTPGAAPRRARRAAPGAGAGHLAAVCRAGRGGGHLRGEDHRR